MSAAGHVDEHRNPVGQDSTVLETLHPNGVLVAYQYRSKSACGDPGDWVYTCNGAQRLQSVTNSLGYQIKFDYLTDTFLLGQDNGDWQILTGATAINNAVEYCDPTAHSCVLGQAWPSIRISGTGQSSNLEQVTLPNGEVWQYRGDGQTFGVRRPGASVDHLTLAFDPAANRLTLVKDGSTWTYTGTFSSGRQTRTVQGPLGYSRTVVSDPGEELVYSDRDPLGRTTNYEYDSMRRMTKAIRPEGDSTRYEYDARGNVTATIDTPKPGSNLAERITTAGFPATCDNVRTCNKPLWTADAAGNRTDYAYDPAHGGVVSVASPANGEGVRPQRFFTYGAAQARYRQRSANGGVASGPTVYLPTGSTAHGTFLETRYDVSSATTNLLATQTLEGAQDGSLVAATALGYDVHGNVVAVDGPLPGAGDVTRSWYDSSRRVTAVIGPDPDGAGPLRHRAQRTLYTPDGQVGEQQVGTASGYDPAAISVLQATRTRYDGWARAVGTESWAGGTMHALAETSYDALGRRDCVVQRMNPANFSSWTPACQLTAEGADGPDRIGRTVYDLAGQVLAEQEALGTPDAANDWSATYTPNGLRETLTDGEGNRTSYAYDGFGRLSATFYPSPSGAGVSNPNDYEGLSYDARGLVTRRRLRNGHEIVMAYDARGLLVSKDMPLDETDLTYRHDLLGRLTEQTKGADVLRWSHDALGRAVTETSRWGTLSYGHDLAGRRTRQTWADGFHVDYDHLVTGEMTAVREQGATSGTGVLATYAYDDLGRRVRISRGNGTTTSYAYDPMSRLSALTEDLAGTAWDQNVGFTHNPAGQITSRTASNDAYAIGLLASDQNEAVNGLNQLTGLSGTAGTAGVVYDTRGNLAEWGGRSYRYSDENRLTFVSGTPGTGRLDYDPVGRLERNGASGLSYQYAGDELVAEWTDSGALARRYVHGAGEDDPLVWYEHGTRRWYHVDERGSVIAWTGEDGGLHHINRYDEYGAPASSNGGRFQYTGQASIDYTGLYHYKARAYAPGLGRFMQTDPIGTEDQVNLYAYSGLDPINEADPSGECFKCW